MRFFLPIALLLAVATAYPTPVPSAAELHMRESEDDSSSTYKRGFIANIADGVKKSARDLLDPIKDFGEDVKETAVENWEKLEDEASKIKITPPTIETE